MKKILNEKLKKMHPVEIYLTALVIASIIIGVTFTIAYLIVF
jgi:hypothetical protein